MSEPGAYAKEGLICFTPTFQRFSSCFTWFWWFLIPHPKLLSKHSVQLNIAHLGEGRKPEQGFYRLGQSVEKLQSDSVVSAQFEMIQSSSSPWELTEGLGRPPPLRGSSSISSGGLRMLPATFMDVFLNPKVVACPVKVARAESPSICLVHRVYLKKNLKSIGKWPLHQGHRKNQSLWLVQKLFWIFLLF